jgi:hypothetical protein
MRYKDFAPRSKNVSALFVLTLAVRAFNACTAYAQSPTPPDTAVSPLTSFAPIGWGQTSAAPVAAVNYNGADVYAYRANDSTGHIWYSIGGGQPRLVGGNTSTDAGPTLVQAFGLLYIFHTGTNGKLYFDTLSANNTFDGNWREVAGIADQTGGQTVNPRTRPAVTLATSFLLIAATFNDQHMRWFAIDGAGNTPTKGWADIPGDGRTQTDITLATFDAVNTGLVVAAHTGLDQHIYTNVASLINIQSSGQPWTNQWRREPGGGVTSAGPTLLTTPGTSDRPDQVYLGMVGTDGHPWDELLDWSQFGDQATLTVASGGAWAPLTNGSQNNVFTSSAVGMASLRGDAPSGQTNPTVICDERTSALVVRKQLN